MRTLVRLCARTACALIMSATGFAQHYTQTNLVSNTSGVAPVTDPQLINPWGLSRGSGSPWWVSDSATGFSTLYNGAGAKLSLIVTIPPADPTNKNTPTGIPTGPSSMAVKRISCLHQEKQPRSCSQRSTGRLLAGIQLWG
jgi:hypothetical protein